jgi:hypothetical protein
MAKALTAASVQKHRPDPRRRREIPDGRMAGLYLVIQPSGLKSWCVRYRYAGGSRKLTVGPYPAFDLGDAREEAQQVLQRVQRGGDARRGSSGGAAQRSKTISRVSFGCLSNATPSPTIGLGGKWPGSWG